MDDRMVTVDQAIHNTQMRRPHVVIVGAGASRAAFPDGDRNGALLPLMVDFVDVVGLAQALEEAV